MISAQHSSIDSFACKLVVSAFGGLSVPHRTQHIKLQRAAHEFTRISILKLYFSDIGALNTTHVECEKGAARPGMPGQRAQAGRSARRHWASRARTAKRPALAGMACFRDTRALPF